MPTFALPFLDENDIRVEGAAEQLAAWLEPPFHASIADRIGVETLARAKGNRLLLKGEKFGTPQAWTQGLRYMALDEKTGKPMAVLNVSLRKKPGERVIAIVSNIYVRPDKRRRGLAYSLLDEARRDYPRLCLDGALSETGAALFGHVPRKKNPKPR